MTCRLTIHVVGRKKCSWLTFCTGSAAIPLQICHSNSTRAMLVAQGQVPFLACACEIMQGKSDNFGPAWQLCFKEKLDSHQLLC